MTPNPSLGLLEVYCIKCGEPDDFPENQAPPKFVCDDCEEKERMK